MKLKLAKLLARLPWFYFEHGYFAHYDPKTGQPSKIWFCGPFIRLRAEKW